MCGFAVNLINFETLTGRQKKELKKVLQRRKQVLQAQVGDLNRALKAVAKKSKRPRR
jgi:hypothetical protein